MIQVILYSREDCHLCRQTQADLLALRPDYPHTLAVVDVDSSVALQRQFGFEVPVVEIGSLVLKAPITPAELRQALVTAGEPAQPANAATMAKKPQASSYNTGASWSRSDSLTYWLSRHYLALLNSLLAIYILLPFVAPTLLKAGYPAPAGLIYKMYSATCHQLAFRSFFLYGEQAIYPRQAAGFSGLSSYGQASGLNEGSDTSDLLAARSFTGNPAMGYKVALCERDVALYGSILLFGLLYAATGRRIRALPWYLWVLFGLVPIGLDGLSQLFSQPPFNFIPYRESTPYLRLLTGFLFGFTTAWFGLPAIEASMRDTREMMEAKLSKVQAARQAGNVKL